MKNDRENWADVVKDAASGYGAAILGVICFLLTLSVVMAAVRFIVGISASTGTGV